jgi:hypothetical protein
MAANPKPTYKEVLHTKFNCVGHKNELYDLAIKLEYPYFIWSGRVYEAHTDHPKDTDFLATDVH